MFLLLTGISRSASCLLAYMISHHNLTLREAFQLMKRRRNLVEPNPSFMEQLITYERIHRGVTSVSVIWQTNGLPFADVLYDYPHNLPIGKIRAIEEKASRLPIPPGTLFFKSTSIGNRVDKLLWHRRSCVTSGSDWSCEKKHLQYYDNIPLDKLIVVA